jgi:hypothetical protein
MCNYNEERNNFKHVLAKLFMEIFVINANLVSGKYQSNQQGESKAVNIFNITK